jgi:hypothetical protein
MPTLSTGDVSRAEGNDGIAFTVPSGSGAILNDD